MTTQVKDFKDLYLAELNEARSVEDQLVAALPKMAEAASEPELRKAFEEHLAETQEHRAIVEGLLKRHDAGGDAHTDQAMQTLIQEAEKMMGQVPKGPLLDASLIASAQRIEHYEIALYGTLATYAECMDLADEKQLLAGILEEEKDTDDLLSDIADGVVNQSAVEVD